MVRDQERLEEFKAINRNSFELFSDELYFLYHQKVLSELSRYFDIPISLDNTVNSKLERHFNKEYGWIKKQDTKKIKGIDSKCGSMYTMSVYKPISENRTVVIKGISYPLNINN